MSKNDEQIESEEKESGANVEGEKVEQPASTQTQRRISLN